MRINRLALTLALTAALAGCEKVAVFDHQRIVVEVERIRPGAKAGSSVDLRDIKTNRLYKGEPLECYSNKAENIKIGSKWDVTEVTYVYPESGKFFSRLVGIHAICKLSN